MAPGMSPRAYRFLRTVLLVWLVWCFILTAISLAVGPWGNVIAGAVATALTGFALWMLSWSWAA